MEDTFTRQTVVMNIATDCLRFSVEERKDVHCTATRRDDGEGDSRSNDRRVPDNRSSKSNESDRIRWFNEEGIDKP